jgi:hypothetical protein
MRKVWGIVVGKMFESGGKTIELATSTGQKVFTSVYKTTLFTTNSPVFFHSNFSAFVSYKSDFLTIFHTPYNKLLFKLISS